MQKTISFFNILNDFILAGVFVAFIGAAFLGMLSVSDIGVREQENKQVKVLGEAETNTALALIAQDYSTYNLITTTTRTADDGVLTVVKAKSIESNIEIANFLEINNVSSRNYSYTLLPNIPEYYLAGMKYLVKIDGSEKSIYDDKGDKVIHNLVIDVPARSTVKLSMRLLPYGSVNYPVDFSLMLVPSKTVN